VGAPACGGGWRRFESGRPEPARPSRLPPRPRRRASAVRGLRRRSSTQGEEFIFINVRAIRY
jgi:hypothetical protein